MVPAGEGLHPQNSMHGLMCVSAPSVPPKQTLHHPYKYTLKFQLAYTSGTVLGHAIAGTRELVTSCAGERHSIATECMTSPMHDPQDHQMVYIQHQVKIGGMIQVLPPAPDWGIAAAPSMYVSYIHNVTHSSSRGTVHLGARRTQAVITTVSLTDRENLNFWV